MPTSSNLVRTHTSGGEGTANRRPLANPTLQHAPQSAWVGYRRHAGRATLDVHSACTSAAAIAPGCLLINAPSRTTAAIIVGAAAQPTPAGQAYTWAALTAV